MALNPEEMKKRRQAAQQAREQKQAANKKLLIRLAIAVAVLLVVGAVILVIVLAGGPKDPAQEPENPQQAESGDSAQTENPPETEPSAEDPSEEPSGETTSEEPKENATVIHLAAAGDLNINDTTVDAGGVAYLYQNAFLDVAHLLADADISVVNFEGGLYGNPFGSETASAPQSMMDALADAGVDLVQLANSYSINNGVSGLRSTINGVKMAGMEPLGVYNDNAEAAKSKGFTLCNVNGVKIAFVAFTKGMDGMALPAGSEGCVNVLYSDYNSNYQKVDTAGITRVMEAAAAARPDLTVVLVHWGSEFNDTVSSSQKKILSLLQSEGADAIIGTHPHYVQEMKLDPETGSFIAYSLGDFFGDAARSGSEYSVILDLEITKDHKTGETKITNYSYTPIFTVVEKNKPARVVRIHETMRAYDNLFLERIDPATYDAMAYALGRIEARIHPEE